MFETLYDMYAGLDKLRYHLDANSVNILNDSRVLVPCMLETATKSIECLPGKYQAQHFSNA
jgi:hypothetical protein